MWPPRGAGKSSGESIRGGTTSRASRTPWRKRHAPQAPLGLAELLQSALREHAANVDDALMPVDVGTFERDPLLGSQPGSCCEDRDGREPRIELARNRFQFVPRGEWSDLPRLNVPSPAVLYARSRVLIE